MKKTGRGRGYERALNRNLVKSLQTHKRITTTKKRARMIASSIILKPGESIKTVPYNKRRGDGADMVVVMLNQQKKDHEKKPDTNKTK